MKLEPNDAQLQVALQKAAAKESKQVRRQLAGAWNQNVEGACVAGEQLSEAVVRRGALQWHVFDGLLQLGHVLQLQLVRAPLLTPPDIGWQARLQTAAR